MHGRDRDRARAVGPGHERTAGRKWPRPRLASREATRLLSGVTVGTAYRALSEGTGVCVLVRAGWEARPVLSRGIGARPRPAGEARSRAERSRLRRGRRVRLSRERAAVLAPVVTRYGPTNWPCMWSALRIEWVRPASRLDASLRDAPGERPAVRSPDGPAWHRTYASMRPTSKRST